MGEIQDDKMIMYLFITYTYYYFILLLIWIMLLVYGNGMVQHDDFGSWFMIT